MTETSAAVDLSVPRYREIFACSTDYYAVGRPQADRPEKYHYFKVAEPLTDALLQTHFAGTQTLGIYPLVQGRCKWFCIDVDAGGVAPHPEGAVPEAVWALGQAQVQRFNQAGLEVYMERSRSGTGVHVWGFLAEWMDAVVVRRAIYPLIVDSPLVDRGKIYPSDPTKSQLGVLICAPYSGHWSPQGGTVFVDPDTAAPIDRETFLAGVVCNNASILRHLAATARVERPANGEEDDGDRAERTTRYIGREVTPESGRPNPLLPHGILKMCSSEGCRFMHHVYTNLPRTDETGRPLISEPEYYAALGQLTAFQHGRKAAHLMSQGHAYYRPGSPWLDQKYDHALQNPPMGCAAIREKFPHLACKGCQNKAPYYTGSRPLVEMADRSAGDVRRAAFQEDLVRIRHRNSGQHVAGVKSGIHALDPMVLLRPTEITFIGARPSIGKTAFMTHMSCGIAREGTPVLMFSAETTRDPLHDRLVAHEAQVDSRALRGERARPLNTDEWTRIERAVETLADLPIYENYGATDPEDVMRLIESTLITHSIPFHAPYVVFYDFLQYGLSAKGDDMFSTTSRRTFEWKYLQKVLQHHVAVFSQVTRESEGKDTPTLSWFRGSGEIEILADNAWIITGQRIDGPEAPRTIWVVKQKEGSVGSVEVVLQQAISRVVSAVPQSAAPPSPFAADPSPEALRLTEEFEQWHL